MTDTLNQMAKHIWAQGNYDAIARLLEPAAEELCDAAGVGEGTRVLDVGAGTGNVVLAAARRGAQVTASDVAPSMVERGSARTAELGVAWHEADARALPFEDGAFDVALSCFGAIFAPEPERVAGEMLRVVRPGGLVAITAWVDAGPQAEAFRLLARHLPERPPGAPEPESWGDPNLAEQRFAVHGAAVTVDEHALMWAIDGGLDGWMEHFQRDAPPVAAARQLLGEERWPPIRDELRAVIEPMGEIDAEGRFATRSRYLMVRARAAQR